MGEDSWTRKFSSWFIGLTGFARAAIAITSVSSVYLFGLTVPFARGIRTLVDLKFFANEALIFLLFVAGLGVVVRFQLAIIRYVYARQIRPSDTLIEKLGSHGKVYRRKVSGYLTIVISVVLFGCTALATLSGVFHPIFLLAWLISVSLIFFLFLIMISKYGFDEVEVAILEGFRRIVLNLRERPMEIAQHPFIFAFFVALVLMAAYSLGSFRMRTLATAEPICAVLDDRVIRGRLLGETTTGLLIRLGETSASFVPSFSFPTDEGKNRVVFVNRNAVQSVEPNCPAG